MRRLIVFALVAWTAVPAVAARRVTVAQLTEALAADAAEHRGDQEIAHQISTMDLSERLTTSTLDRLAAKLPLQPRTALALQLLADQSAFLDPPTDEFPATAPPDPPTQQQMLAAARGYAVETWGRLPNFFVSRVTTRFDDGAQVLRKGDWPVRAGLHPVGQSAREITFRDGKEVPGQATANPNSPAKGTSEMGLRSWGEFGPALTVVLLDMASQKATFRHWEQIAGRLGAVYRYQVPRESSHYAVTYSTSSENVPGRSEPGYVGRNLSSQQMASIPGSSDLQVYSEKPGYHGAIAIDPSTGAVLRLTIEAELSAKDPLLRAATMVEYGPIQIGDRTFICPVRSLAISVDPQGPNGCTQSTEPIAGGDASRWPGSSGCTGRPLTLINESRFAEYHRLGSTARIITDASTVSGTAPPGGPTAGSAENASVPEPNPQPPSTAPTEEPATASASPPPAEPPAPPTEPVIPEISVTASNNVPDTSANAETAKGFSIKVTSRLVDVGVVAFDKKGHPVPDLKAEEFEVYDNGRKQEVRFFTAAPGGGAQPALPAASQPLIQTFPNRAAEAVSAAASPGTTETGPTILLIDESHIAWPDLHYARQQMVRFVGALAPGERVGLYSMTGLGFRVLLEATSDHAALAARLQSFLPSSLALAQAQDEERRNRQQFNEVHNAADLNSVNGNHTDVPDDSQPVDPQLLTMGSDPARASLIILAQVARHLAGIAGHKNLVWVSSDYVFADWQSQQVGIDKSPREAQAFAIHVQEAMNDAHTAVYPFDVSQLEGASITADIEHRNVELTPGSADNAATAAAAGGPAQSGRNMQPGRLTAGMSQDLHPMKGIIRDVATSTGGRTIRRTGELASALTGIVEDGHAIYQLSFSPQGPADDQYHAITVKLAGRRGVSLRYRTGYIFGREPATLKERFQAAVWRPLDVSDIAVSADIDPGESSAAVRLNIAAGDLEMRQQADRWIDKLDIFFIQRDDADLHAHLEGQTLGLRLKPATYQNLLPTGVPYSRSVELRPGTGSLRVVVVDENSGRMGSVTIPSYALKATL